MLKIQDKFFNLDVETILVTLREYVKLRFDKTLFRLIKNVNDDIMTNCPYHSSGQEKKPSFGIQKSTGIGHCFTCHKVVSIDELIGNVLGDYSAKAFITGYNWLVETFEDTQINTRKSFDLPIRTTPSKQFYIPEEILDKYRYYHPYMWERHLTEKVVEDYDVGYDDNFELKNETTGKITRLKCLTFPVKDITGKVVFIARRCIDQKLFHYPAHVQKPVYGLEKCFNAKSLIVVESIINCLTLATYGLNAVALLGLGTKQQYELLNKSSARVLYCCFDGDAAGHKGLERLLKNIQNKIIYNIQMIDGEDVNSITKEQFFNLYKSAQKIK